MGVGPKTGMHPLASSAKRRYNGASMREAPLARGRFLFTVTQAR